MGVTHVRPRVGISRCLLGDEVRYDGTHKRADAVIAALDPYVEWVPVCPEVEIGMGTPREPIRLVARPDGVRSLAERVRLVGVTSGEDWTDRMRRWARERVRELERLDLSGYILKASSPSCGIHGVRVAHERGGMNSGEGEPAEPVWETRTGRGLFAQALIEAMPALPIADEERLSDADAREQFLERVRRTFRMRTRRT